MRDWLVIVSTGLAISATTAARPPASHSQHSVALSAQVDALFLREIRPDTPGCAVGVYRSGELVLARGYGVASIEDGRPITPRSTFNLGSASKPFTALAALMLEERGQLSMDDDVRRWVPELPDYGTRIRVRDLLQHTSGLRDFGTLQQLSGRAVTTQPQFLGLVAAQRALNFEPGTRHEYSHTDYGVLGLIVQRIAGDPFGEHLRNAVLDPMGMKGSGVWRSPPAGNLLERGTDRGVRAGRWFYRLAAIRCRRQRICRHMVQPGPRRGMAARGPRCETRAPPSRSG